MNSANLMKKSMLALGIAAATLSSSPARASTPPPRLIAQVHSSGGLVPPGTVNAQGVRIFTDGSVIAYRDEKLATLARLAPGALAKLRSVFAVVQSNAPLVDNHPDEPLCTDAPVLEYRIFPSPDGGGAPLVIGRNSGCHEYYMQTGEGITARYALEDLRQLASYIAF